MKPDPRTTAGLRGAGAFGDGAAVGKGTQGKDMRLVGARYRQANRFGARCDQQTVEG
jgi:hypothetical protein